MDRITTSYLRAFCDQQTFPSDPQDVAFEHFSNFCIVAQHHDDEFDVEQVHTGGGYDLGIDGLAVSANGALVTTPEEVTDLIEVNGYLDVDFVFVQAKSSSSFDGGEIAKFLDGVEEFFRETPSLPTNERIDAARDVMAAVYDNSVKFKRGKPRVSCYYVCTGKWTGDPYLAGKIETCNERLRATGLFEVVSTRLYGADELHAAYTRTAEAASAEFVFANKTLLPEINGIAEAYIGVVPVSEFISIVEDERGGIRKSLFVENVRDFLESNPVNDSIALTLLDSSARANFAVLNNGVTIVTRSLQTTGNKFAISDYQVVNGCQTSHVLHAQKDYLDDSVTIPLKVIHTDDEDLITAIVTATNSQTTVTQEDLYALGAFQKKMEAFFIAHEPAQQLYYERRSKQYNSVSGIEKVRIITKAQLIRAFAAMFLDDAHRANRYYSALQAQVGHEIFGTEHSPEAYYTAAFAYYKLEYLFRNGAIAVAYKPARYHLLMAMRHLANSAVVPDHTNARAIEKYCNSINKSLWNDVEGTKLFKSATGVIDHAFGPPPSDKDAFKTQASTDSVLSALP